MAIELPPLPFDAKALEPHISANTLGFHHGKHHAAYVTNYNNLTKDTPYAGRPLEEVLAEIRGDASKVGIFNNGAQIWNHSFFWNCLKPGGGGKPTGAVAGRIDSDFGGYDKFVEAFKTAAVTQFGSGWAWLALDKSKGRLTVTKTPNADMPQGQGLTPLLTVDVWEHAYYLDYQNRRPDFVQAVIDHLLNWDFANRNLAAA